MEVELLHSPPELKQYNQWVKNHPGGSLWQSLEWKEYQEALGREVRIYVKREEEGICASALVMIDRTLFGLSTWEIPRGPLETENGKRKTGNDKILEHIIADAKKGKCFTFYFSPTSYLETKNQKLKTSKRYVVPEATRIINLQQSEEEILSQMKPKGRYNIHVAQKHGVVVEQETNVDAFYELVQETTQRDKFKSLPKDHYQAFLGSLKDSFMLLALLPQNKKPIAGLLGVFWNQRAVYYYGASSYAHRASMAPYLLQWEAMRFCKEKGCKSYDLFGIEPRNGKWKMENGKFHKASSSVFHFPFSVSRFHPWHGVTAFKEKFGGEVVTYPEEKVRVLKPMVHRLVRWKRKIFS